MKKLFIYLLTIIIISYNSWAQSLNFESLLSYQKSNFELINDNLALKKWHFVTSDSGLVYWEHYKYITESVKKCNEMIYIDFNTNLKNAIIYKSSFESFQKLKQEAKLHGFIFISNEQNGESINSIYKKNDLYIKFYNKPNPTSNTAEQPLLYNISIFTKDNEIRQELTKSKLVVLNPLKTNSSNDPNNQNIKIEYMPSSIFEYAFSAKIIYEVNSSSKLKIIEIEAPIPLSDKAKLQRDFELNAKVIGKVSETIQQEINIIVR